MVARTTIDHSFGTVKLVPQPWCNPDYIHNGIPFHNRFHLRKARFSCHWQMLVKQGMFSLKKNILTHGLQRWNLVFAFANRWRGPTTFVRANNIFNLVTAGKIETLVALVFCWTSIGDICGRNRKPVRNLWYWWAVSGYKPTSLLKNIHRFVFKCKLTIGDIGCKHFCHVKCAYVFLFLIIT